MRIGFDAKRAFFNATGLGNYSRELLSALWRLYPESEYYLYTPKPASGRFPAFEAEAAHGAITRSPRSFWGRSFSSLWRSAGISGAAARDRLDIYHGLSFEIPWNMQKRGIKTVVTVYDLIFLKYPKFYPFIDRKIYEAKFDHACRNADLIVTISEQSKADLLERFGNLKREVGVVYPACHPRFNNRVSAEAKSAVRRKYNLPSRYILCVGTINERKNLLTLVRAFERLDAKEQVSLVALGRGGAYLRKVEAYVKSAGLTDRVQFLNSAASEDLPAIYQQAALFAYPSFYEGFGIPILEALLSRVPVVTSQGGCFPEAGGPQSLYVNPADPDELASALNRGLSDEPLRQRMIDAGATYAAAFTVEAAARAQWALYQNLLKESA